MVSIIQIIKKISIETDVKFEDIWQMLFDYGYCDKFANLSDEVKELYDLK